jgi:hypothetical protein
MVTDCANCTISPDCAGIARTSLGGKQTTIRHNWRHDHWFPLFVRISDSFPSPVKDGWDRANDFRNKAFEPAQWDDIGTLTSVKAATVIRSSASGGRTADRTTLRECGLIR